METQTGPISPEAPIVSVDEDVLVSQVLEIIGGNAAEALTTPGEPEEGQEEGGETGDGAGETEAEEETSEVQQHNQPPKAEDQSQAVDREAQRHRNTESTVQLEAELKNSAEPGQFWSISNLA